MSITFLFLYNTLQCYLFYKFKYSFFSQQLPFSPASPTSSLYCNIPINKQKLCNGLHFKQIRHALPFLNPMAPPVVTLFLIPLCSKLLKRVFCICQLPLLPPRTVSGLSHNGRPQFPPLPQSAGPRGGRLVRGSTPTY